MAKPKGKAAGPLKLDVKFGDVSIGEETASVGITISRANLTVAAADRDLCCKRLTGRLVARSNNGQAGQESLPGMQDADPAFDAAFDTAGFTAKSKTITLRLTFRLGSIDVPTFARFAKREGQVTVNEIADLPEGYAADEE